MELKPCRATAHRAYIASKFGAADEDGNVVELTIAQIMGNPKSSKLGIEVFLKLQEQFTEYGIDRGIGQDDEKYRRQLENLANILETLLEETLNEIEALDRG